MTKVLLTGGIGSGKSLAAKYLRSKGLFVYDSDGAVHNLYSWDVSLRRKLALYFGEEILDSDGGINRGRLSRKVFGHPDALEALEAMVHPAVMEDFLRQAHLALEADDGVAIMESAIAGTKKMFKGFFDMVIVVDAPAKTRLERVFRRDGLSASQVLERMRAQEAAMLYEPDFRINNDSTPQNLYDQLDIICKQLKIN